MSENTTETNVHRADIPGAEDKDLATITLAHPLDKDRDLQTLGLPLGQPIGVGETVMIRKDHAKTLITAGYAQVDPEDADAVRKALHGEAQEQQDTEPSAENASLVEQNEAVSAEAAPADVAGVGSGAEAAQAGGVTGDSAAAPSAETPASTAGKAGKGGAAARAAASGS